MKKIFLGILAFCAVVLSSCGGDEPHLKNFKVEIAEKGPAKAVFKITPTDKEGKYTFGIMTRKYFDTKWDDDIENTALTAESGDATYTANYLYPASEYVFVIIPVVPNPEKPSVWSRAGETEYMFFSTPDWPLVEDNGQPYNWDGKVEFYDGSTTVKITFANSDEQLYLVLNADKPYGTFTKKNLESYSLFWGIEHCGIYANFESFYKYNGVESPIYDIDFTGTYDVNSSKYIYEGNFWMSCPEYDEGLRAPFKITCSKKK